MILVVPGTILAMTPNPDLLSGPTKENARTSLSFDGSNGPTKDSLINAHTLCKMMLGRNFSIPYDTLGYITM